MNFRKVREQLWNYLQRVLSRDENLQEMQPFINKDPDPAKRDYSLFLTYESREVEIALFDKFIQVCDDEDPSSPKRVAYDDPRMMERLQEALTSFGIAVDLEGMEDLFVGAGRG